MKLAQLLTPDEILLDLKAEGHWAAIEELVEGLTRSGKLPLSHKAEALASLKAREEQVSTGIGAGVAIPHAFSDDIGEVIAIFGRSVKGVDFNALDGKKVHLIILFIVPRRDYHLHLRTLAAIAKMFTNSEVRRQMIEAGTPEDILSILDSRPSRTGPITD